MKSIDWINKNCKFAQTASFPQQMPSVNTQQHQPKEQNSLNEDLESAKNYLSELTGPFEGILSHFTEILNSQAYGFGSNSSTQKLKRMNQIVKEYVEYYNQKSSDLNKEFLQREKEAEQGYKNDNEVNESASGNMN